MSGSSLDGVDLALCKFEGNGNKILWKILKSSTYRFDDNWKQRLACLPNSSAREIALADYEFGYYLGRMVREFSPGLKPDYIASHGHTIFHEPQNGMTFQVGNGAAIAAASGISTISDFRSSDICRGGQGAPLVSIIDRDLFPGYAALVNLGGISNISFNNPDKLIAYDICPCNQLLNYLSSKLGMDFDNEGKLASQDKSAPVLLKKMLELDYFNLSYPKSLDNNYIKMNFMPILENCNISIEDKLASCVEMIVFNLRAELNRYLPEDSAEKRVLLTGGGAKNKFLVKRIKQICKNISIIVPDISLIDFKEALLMAYIGYLRVLERPNVISSVTGAACDSRGGAIYLA